MSSLQGILLIAGAAFVVLWLRAPKRPALALAYLRWVVLLGVSPALRVVREDDLPG